MAFLDDAKAFAEQAQRSLDQAVQQVSERIDQLNQRRSFNELARQLGMLVYRARAAHRDPDPAEVSRLCDELARVEAELMAPRPSQHEGQGARWSSGARRQPTSAGQREGQGQGPAAGADAQTTPTVDPDAPTQAQNRSKRDYTLDDLEG